MGKYLLMYRKHVYRDIAHYCDVQYLLDVTIWFLINHRSIWARDAVVISRPVYLCATRNSWISWLEITWNRDEIQVSVLQCMYHYSDVTWPWWRPRSPAIRVFAQQFARADVKETSKLRVTGPLYGESTGDRCIPLTKGPGRLPGKFFHVMTSS